MNRIEQFGEWINTTFGGGPDSGDISEHTSENYVTGLAVILVSLAGVAGIGAYVISELSR